MADHNEYTEYIELSTVTIAEIDKIRLLQKNTHGEDVTRSDVIIWLMNKVTEDMEFRSITDNLQVRKDTKE